MANLVEEVSATPTFSDYAFERLRADIVSGSLAAETKLAMKDLAARYRVGVSPLREALHRLAGEGFVDFVGQRGFTVPPLSMSDLEDLIQLRTLVEEAAVRQAMKRGDDAWEAGIVSAFYRLERQIGRFGQGSDEAIQQFETVHRAFHVALYANVISPGLANMHGNLFDKAYRYRKTLHFQSISHEEFLVEHKGLMNVILSGDVEAAVIALRRHLTLTRDATQRYLAAKSKKT